MPKARRELLLRLHDGDDSVCPFLHFLDGMVHCDTIGLWFVANGYTGKKLSEFVRIEHAGSMLGAVKTAVRRIEKLRVERDLFSGRDFKTIGRN